jgi:hypothetical protein
MAHTAVITARSYVYNSLAVLPSHPIPPKRRVVEKTVNRNIRLEGTIQQNQHFLFLKQSIGVSTTYTKARFYSTKVINA